MASLQIQRTRNAETVTKTAIDQKQSLEVVQTMLHSSLSSIAYLRNFFPEKVFEEQTYEMSDKIHPYDDYAAGRLTRDFNGAKEPRVKIQTLCRGRSRRVDKLLSWLEQGAFPALKAGHLRALQIYVHPVESGTPDRGKVLEIYTFTFTYQTDQDGNGGIEDPPIDGPQKVPVHVEASIEALRTLLLQLNDLCDGLPDLPGNHTAYIAMSVTDSGTAKRMVSMELFYRSGFEKLSNIQDFEPSHVSTMSLPKVDGWEKSMHTLPALDGFFHRSGMSVTSMIQPSVYGRPHAARTALPEDAHYTSTESKLAMISGQTRLFESVLEDQLTVGSTAATPSTVVDELPRRLTSTNGACEVARLSDDTAVPHEATGECGPSHLSEEMALLSSMEAQSIGTPSSQASSVMNIKNAFRGMNQAEVLTQGDTQTQSQQLLKPVNQAQSLKRSSRVAALRHTSETDETYSRQPTLPRQAAKPSMNAANIVRKTPIGRPDSRPHRSDKADVMRCDCGQNREEGATVQCTSCHAWQHLPCYGYTGDNDPRIPEEHTCYSCLLGEDEMPLRRKLQELALRRRTIDIALHDGLSSVDDLASDLNVEPTRATAILDSLQQDGFLTANTSSRRQKTSGSKKLLLSVVSSGHLHEKMLRSLFDPATQISNYKPKPANAVDADRHTKPNQANHGRSRMMLPPVTPASRMHQRSAPTPATGLDARESMTPYVTPSRPQSQQSIPRKRRSDEESSLSGPPSRLATPKSSIDGLRSLQSLSFIDVNGLPSSTPNTPGR